MYHQVGLTDHVHMSQVRAGATTYAEQEGGWVDGHTRADRQTDRTAS